MMNSSFNSTLRDLFSTNPSKLLQTRRDDDTQCTSGGSGNSQNNSQPQFPNSQQQFPNSQQQFPNSQQQFQYSQQADFQDAQDSQGYSQTVDSDSPSKRFYGTYCAPKNSWRTGFQSNPKPVGPIPKPLAKPFSGGKIGYHQQLQQNKARARENDERELLNQMVATMHDCASEVKSAVVLVTEGVSGNLQKSEQQMLGFLEKIQGTLESHSEQMIKSLELREAMEEQVSTLQKELAMRDTRISELEKQIKALKEDNHTTLVSELSKAVTEKHAETKECLQDLYRSQQEELLKTTEVQGQKHQELLYQTEKLHQQVAAQHSQTIKTVQESLYSSVDVQDKEHQKALHNLRKIVDGKMHDLQERQKSVVQALLDQQRRELQSRDNVNQLEMSRQQRQQLVELQEVQRIELEEFFLDKMDDVGKRQESTLRTMIHEIWEEEKDKALSLQAQQLNQWQLKLQTRCDNQLEEMRQRHLKEVDRHRQTQPNDSYSKTSQTGPQSHSPPLSPAPNNHGLEPWGHQGLQGQGQPRGQVDLASQDHVRGQGDSSRKDQTRGDGNTKNQSSALGKGSFKEDKSPADRKETTDIICPISQEQPRAESGPVLPGCPERNTEDVDESQGAGGSNGVGGPRSSIWPDTSSLPPPSPLIPYYNLCRNVKHTPLPLDHGGAGDQAGLPRETGDQVGASDRPHNQPYIKQEMFGTRRARRSHTPVTTDQGFISPRLGQRLFTSKDIFAKNTSVCSTPTRSVTLTAPSPVAAVRPRVACEEPKTSSYSRATSRAATATVVRDTSVSMARGIPRETTVMRNTDRFRQRSSSVDTASYIQSEALFPMSPLMDNRQYRYSCSDFKSENDRSQRNDIQPFTRYTTSRYEQHSKGNDSQKFNVSAADNGTLVNNDKALARSQPRIRRIPSTSPTEGSTEYRSIPTFALQSGTALGNVVSKDVKSTRIGSTELRSLDIEPSNVLNIIDPPSRRTRSAKKEENYTTTTKEENHNTTANKDNKTTSSHREDTHQPPKDQSKVSNNENTETSLKYETEDNAETNLKSNEIIVVGNAKTAPSNKGKRRKATRGKKKSSRKYNKNIIPVNIEASGSDHANDDVEEEGLAADSETLPKKARPDTSPVNNYYGQPLHTSPQDNHKKVNPKTAPVRAFCDRAKKPPTRSRDVMPIKDRYGRTKSPKFISKTSVAKAAPVMTYHGRPKSTRKPVFVRAYNTPSSAEAKVSTECVPNHWNKSESSPERDPAMSQYGRPQSIVVAKPSPMDVYNFDRLDTPYMGPKSGALAGLAKRKTVKQPWDMDIQDTTSQGCNRKNLQDTTGNVWTQQQPQNSWSQNMQDSSPSWIQQHQASTTNSWAQHSQTTSTNKAWDQSSWNTTSKPLDQDKQTSSNRAATQLSAGKSKQEEVVDLRWQAALECGNTSSYCDGSPPLSPEPGMSSPYITNVGSIFAKADGGSRDSSPVMSLRDVFTKKVTPRSSSENHWPVEVCTSSMAAGKGMCYSSSIPVSVQQYQHMERKQGKDSDGLETEIVAMTRTVKTVRKRKM